MVASTQGTGFGGMASMRKLYLDRFLNHEIPTDILQEAPAERRRGPRDAVLHRRLRQHDPAGLRLRHRRRLPLRKAPTRSPLGKADFVVTGAIDDIGVESVIGFGNMNATANSEEMYAKGIDARFFSRANDRRRGGFVESQGGGTILLTRGDIALKLGLPVAGVVGFVHSLRRRRAHLHPGPGLGALAAGMGGKDSKLVHDSLSSASRRTTSPWSPSTTRPPTPTTRTSPNCTTRWPTPSAAPTATRCSDLPEVAHRPCQGRCLHLPGQRPDPAVQVRRRSGERGPRLRRPEAQARRPHGPAARAAEGRFRQAGLATSLGFGHVSGFAAIVNPGAFEASVANTVGEDALSEWRDRANARLAAGQRRLEEGMMGRAALYEPIDNRRFHEDGRGYDAHEVEKAMLLDPNARLASTGYFEA